VSNVNHLKVIFFLAGGVFILDLINNIVLFVDKLLGFGVLESADRLSDGKAENILAILRAGAGVVTVQEVGSCWDGSNAGLRGGIFEGSVGQRTIHGIFNIVAVGLAGVCTCFAPLFVCVAVLIGRRTPQRLRLSRADIASLTVETNGGVWAFDAGTRDGTVGPLDVVVFVSSVGLGFASEIVDGEAGHTVRYVVYSRSEW
jgi:hypothetical protein